MCPITRCARLHHVGVQKLRLADCDEHGIGAAKCAPPIA
jgi:hypothetical protein